ncbi:MAG: AMP-binding protein, partial [Gammaproteobacteria bacterium]
IENRLMANVDVEHVCVVGMGFAQPLALVTLSAQARSMMSLNPPVQCAAFLAFLETVNEELSRHEQLSHLVLLQDNWSVDNSMLTPTLKIKRHVIEDHYKEKIPIWAKERLPIVMASASPTGRGP